MICITSADDVRTYIDNVRPDVSEDEGERESLTAAIQAADHPPWGADWEDWLSEHVPSLVADLIATREPI